MGVFYYNPNDKANPDGIEIRDDWSESTRSIYKKMFRDSGYEPIQEVGENTQNAFEVSTGVITESRDIDGKPVYKRQWTTRKLIVHISLEKAIQFLEMRNMHYKWLEKIYSDQSLLDWWLRKRTYIKGDAAHKKLCEKLGVTEEFMEEMALKCREIRSPYGK